MIDKTTNGPEGSVQATLRRALEAVVDELGVGIAPADGQPTLKQLAEISGGGYMEAPLDGREPNRRLSPSFAGTDYGPGWRAESPAPGVPRRVVYVVTTETLDD